MLNFSYNASNLTGWSGNPKAANNLVNVIWKFDKEIRQKTDIFLAISLTFTSFMSILKGCLKIRIIGLSHNSCCRACLRAGLCKKNVFYVIHVFAKREQKKLTVSCMTARKERYISEVFSLTECYVLKNENLRYKTCHLKPNKMSS